jgi:hypothetical protein
MLESNVVFDPRLRGNEQKALCPRRDQARSADSEVLVPISSLRTPGASDRALQRA